MAEAAQSRCWRVRGPQRSMVTLQTGLFVEGDIGRLGEAALAYISRTMPIFDVPWRAKTALEDAGVTACRVLSPALLR